MNWGRHGIDVMGKSSGQHKLVCPKCIEKRSNKRDKSLSINITTGMFNCHYCGFNGCVNEIMKEKRTYSLPEINNTQLSDKTLFWFTDVRKISKSTLLRFVVTESSEWMGQVGKNMNCINFNYFRDEVLVNIKFRDAAKNFKMFKDAELIFYNLDAMKDQKEVVICEGEIDCLSLYEAGIFNSVSVPNGASKGSMKLEYLDNCWEVFEDKTKITIATDTDQAGIALREELSRRLGRARCFYVDFKSIGDFKDPNEVLVAKGKEALVEVIKNAKPYPIEGIVNLMDMDAEINDIYHNGYKQGDTIGFSKFDSLLSFSAGQVTGVTGVPNSGKSEFVDEIIVRLTQRHSWKWGIFSAENLPVAIHFTKFAEKFIGEQFYNSDPNYKMTPKQLMEAKGFVYDSMTFMDVTIENLTLDYMLDKIEELVKRKGINGFLLDPWNYIEHDIPNGQSETVYIGRALTKICKCAKRLSVHIIIVAHPTKIKKTKEGVYEVPTLYDISGSSNWFNKLDNGLCVYLNYDSSIVDIYIQKVRFKHTGKKGVSNFKWNYKNGRYTEVGEEPFSPPNKEVALREELKTQVWPSQVGFYETIESDEIPF